MFLSSILYSLCFEYFVLLLKLLGAITNPYPLFYCFFQQKQKLQKRRFFCFHQKNGDQLKWLLTNKPTFYTCLIFCLLIWKKQNQDQNRFLNCLQNHDLFLTNLLY